MTRDGLELAKTFGLDMGALSFPPADEVARSMKKVVCLTGWNMRKYTRLIRLEQIDEATESTSGKFLDRDGTELPC